MTLEQALNVTLKDLHNECKRVTGDCDKCAFRKACNIANSPDKPQHWDEYSGEENYEQMY